MNGKAQKRLDEIMGMSFGDFLPDGQVVLVNLHVRSTGPDGGLHEGSRPPLLIGFSTLEGLHDNFPKLVQAMAHAGLDKDVLPPSAQTVPQWNAGPSLTSLQGAYLCSAFGFYEPDSSKEGAVALLGISTIGGGAQEHLADYLVSHRTVLALRDGVEAVVDRIRAKDFSSLR